MSIFQTFVAGLGRVLPRNAEHKTPGEESPGPSTRRGSTVTGENAVNRIYQQFFVDYHLRGKILDIRHMDEVDGRVKKIHSRSARAAAKGGLKLQTSSDNKRILRAWKEFERRLHLHVREKLESDLRGLMMEGNLPLQIIVSSPDQPRVTGTLRMPTETIVPMADDTGRITDPSHAYEQRDIFNGKTLAVFPLWQLHMVRLCPQNYDDWGSLGRPYLDASRKVWKQLQMTEEDLVVRRRTRAPQRMVHALEGAPEDQLEVYKAGVEKDQTEGNWRDYYINTKGGVQAVGGDANLDQIADVSLLLDTFFSGAPAPKGLFGYAGEMQRDILEDLKRDYFDELDSLQDIASSAYDFVFRLDLLLQGINPDAVDFKVVFAERHAETANQRADHALKLQAMGVPKEMVWAAAGLDAAAVVKQRDAEGLADDPYPDDDPGRPARQPGTGAPRVSITPGNARKGDSGTAISN